MVIGAARAIFFDADGALVDSYAGYRNVWARWSRLRGLSADVVLAPTHARRPVDTIAEAAPDLGTAVEWAVLVGFVNDLDAGRDAPAAQRKVAAPCGALLQPFGSEHRPTETELSSRQSRSIGSTA